MSSKSNLQVIGAGCGRTGTASLKRALEILGYDSCYHMEEVAKNGHCKFWKEFADGKVTDFDDVYAAKNYSASVDFPSAMFWKEQLKTYPNAKVILTVRDPEKWLTSCRATVFASMWSYPGSPLGVNIIMYLLGMTAMTERIVANMFAQNDWSHDNLIKCFNAHNQRVIDECPKDKLLVFEVSQGWEPLCKFLGKPVPNVPFPNVNDTKEFQQLANIMNIIGYTLLGLASLGLGGIVMWGKIYLAHSTECSM